MQDKYDPKEVEPRIQKFWLDGDVFKFDQKSKKPVFSIDSPPPTISGRLHMGHAMSYTHFEIMARFKRMNGFNVFLPIGFDDNGQPTERYIEKKLNINPATISKTEFIKVVKENIKEIEDYFKKDFIALGHSYDWSLLYRTISDDCAKISQTSFLDLHEKDKVYRSEEPTIWCTRCRTALSQADVEDKPRKTKIIYIDFDMEDGGQVQIATTRPELIPACVGLFVNPDDKRYKKLIGKKVRVPLTNQIVNIMKDKKVDPAFGTGVVMICTFGDNTDIEWWKTYNLPVKIILNKDGTLNEHTGKYSGLKLKEAKEKIIADLEADKKIVKKEELDQTVGTCWRCNEPVEYIITKQWFIKLLEKKDDFIEQGRKIKWHPEYYVKRYEDWVNNLKWDWLISRQRHHGIPIPVWYCKKCNEVMLPDKKDLPVDPEVDKPKKKCKCGSSDFIPEKDVFETWMTSSMSPQLASGWSDKEIPKSLRPQAHDIIRTWAFYTIVKSYYHFNKIPWNDVMISGHVLDPKGKAMHKSLGNIIDPIEMIKKYSTDMLRYWTTSGKLGEDISFQEKELVTGGKLLTKLWNASKFISPNLKKSKKVKLTLIDKWLMTKLMKTIKEVTESFNSYDYSVARAAVDSFFWSTFCDNYLEMVKYRIYGSKDEAAQSTLYDSLLSILKMYCPIIPHVTEEIYQNLFKDFEKDESLCVSEWPQYDESLIDEEAEAVGDLAVKTISLLRQWKHDNKLALNAPLKEITINCESKDKKLLEKVVDDIKGTMKVEKINFKQSKDFVIEAKQ